MKKENGFTLVELVIVIVILAVLTATVLPRFVNLEEKATDAILKGALTSLKGAARIGNVYARTETADANGSVDIDGTTVHMHNGYPVARDADTDAADGGAFRGIESLLEVDPAIVVSYSDNTTVRNETQVDNDFVFFVLGGRCVSYQPPQTAGDDPLYSDDVEDYDAVNNTCP